MKKTIIDVVFTYNTSIICPVVAKCLVNLIHCKFVSTAKVDFLEVVKNVSNDFPFLWIIPIPVKGSNGAYKNKRKLISYCSIKIEFTNLYISIYLYILDELLFVLTLFNKFDNIQKVLRKKKMCHIF